MQHVVVGKRAHFLQFIEWTPRHPRLETLDWPRFVQKVIGGQRSLRCAVLYDVADWLLKNNGRESGRAERRLLRRRSAIVSCRRRCRVGSSSMPSVMAEPGVTQKDTTFTKIFVGGLPYHTTDKSLREHFEAYGDIEEAVVITDRQTGKSRGYGFVTMADRLAAERACKDANPIIDGRKANVNLAYIGAKPRGNAQHAGFPFPVRPGYPALVPSQYGLKNFFPVDVPTNGLPPQYIYPSPYLASPGLVPLPHAPISPAAAAAAAGQFYDYPAAAAAAYTGQYPNGFETYPYPSTAAAAAAAASGFVAPGYTYTLPQPVPTGAPGPFPLPYTPQPQIQEARMQ